MSRNAATTTAALDAPLPFVDLAAQRRRLGPRLDAAIAAVLDHGQFIMGPEVAALEEALVAFCGARFAVSCANGTDALCLALMAKGIGPGDAVFVPAFTFAATAGAVALGGAVPVFVDVDATSFNMDPESLAPAVESIRRGGTLRPAAVIPVDLFGQPADYAEVGAIADEHGLVVIADAAQSFGATYRARPVGTLAALTTTSFFPAKPLGCYGDGGAIFTGDAAAAETLRSLRQHGRGRDKHDIERVGTNSRLDTLQAAILLAKLEVFADELVARADAARRYGEGLADVVEVPSLPSEATSSWAQYTIKLDNGDTVAARMKAEGIPTAVYYPNSINHCAAYAHCPTAPGGTPVAEALTGRVLSLPMHTDLDPATQDRIIAAVHRAVRA